VYQKLAPLVSDAFSSRVSSATSGMVMGFFRSRDESRDRSAASDSRKPYVTWF
jgi:hypothetical protein